MKSLFSKPRYELVWPSVWMFLLAGVLICLGITSESLLLGTIGAFILLLAIGVWQEMTSAMVAGLIFMSLIAISHLIGAFTGKPPLRKIVYAVSFASIAYSCYDGLKQKRLEQADFGRWLEDQDDNESEMSDEDTDADAKPFISVVLLQRQQKYLESIVLQQLVQSTWQVDFSDSEENFVVGEPPLFLIQCNNAMYIVHNHEDDYWEDKQAVVDDIQELRLSKAVADHQAWLSVDLLGEPEDVDGAYEMIIKLIEALADEDTLVVLRPESREIYPWSDEIAEEMLQRGFQQLNVASNAPVVPISADDERLQQAYADAANGLPGFIKRFQSPEPGDENFTVKIALTVNDVTEFIWANVIGFEPKFVHATLANDPVDLGDLKLGDQIEAPLEDIYDWGYVDDEPQGFFTVKAIQEIQRQSNET